MTIKIGQRWLLNTDCHKFIVQINKVHDDNFGYGKIVQVVERSRTCGLSFGIGSEFNVHGNDSCWEYLSGQDAPC